MSIRTFLGAFLFSASVVVPVASQRFVAPDPQPGSISGSVVDVNDGIIPGATVVLLGPVAAENRTIESKDDGSFQFDEIMPGLPYHVTISAVGFTAWTSPKIAVAPGQALLLKGSKLAVSPDADVGDSVRFLQ